MIYNKTKLGKSTRMVFTSALLLSTFFACSENSKPLASYDGGFVTEAEFLNHYEKYLTVTGITDNLPDRKKILRSVLHEALILKNWQELEMDENPDVKNVLRRQEEQAILDALWKEKSKTDREPSPEELAEMLIHERTRFHLQLVSDLAIESAQDIAMDWSLNGTSPSMHDLGFVSLEDIHPRLVSIVGNLKASEISKPIRLGNAYTLIKLVEKQFPHFIRPRDFAVAQERLKQEWQVAQSDLMMDTHTKKVLANLKLEFSEEGCSDLLDLLMHSQRTDLQAIVAEHPAAPKTVCTSVDGEWSIAMLMPHLLDSRPEHLDAIIDTKDLHSVVAGSLVRRALLLSAREAGIQKRDYTRDAIRKRQDLWRLKTWQQRFADTVALDEEYLASVFQRDNADKSKIRMRDVEYLVYPDSSLARIAFETLQKDSSLIGELNPSLSRADLPLDGKMGWVTTDELGQASSLVFSQELNTWTKPWNYKGEIYLFRSLAEKNETMNFTIDSEKIESEVRHQGAPVQLEQTLIAMERSNHAEIHEDRIKNIPFIQLTGQVNEG
ncbi:MAG: hypothetical protein HQ507_01235 [Candidatus Marinimicrobia bacterium]|nr:hypothetical protein [Candidatus Neomarinimicrobiota bacterium]